MKMKVREERGLNMKMESEKKEIKNIRKQEIQGKEKTEKRK